MTVTDSDTSTSPRTTGRRWLWIALVASLAVNALFIGISARALWHARNVNFLSVGGIDRGLPGFVETLPGERRARLKSSGLLDRRAALRPLRRELRQARTEAVRAFTADPFDKMAFEAAENRLAQAEQRLRGAIRATLVEVGEQMTLEERRALLRYMRPGGHRGRDGRFGGRWRRDREPAPPDSTPHQQSPQ